MNKFTKKDWIYLSILIISFFIMVIIILGKDYIYGSNVDWESQHIAFPDYFRTLFYDSKNLLPSFAFNIGAGQNIYNFAYYGFLSPIVMLAYILPFIDMAHYMMGAAMISVVTSGCLFYKWLRNNNFTANTAFLTSFIFMFSTGLTLHSHRHIMFMLYMPFLMLALLGVDKYFKDNKKSLLIAGTFLMIMTSFYYSIPGILAIIAYGIYRYMTENKKISFKAFIKDGFKFLLPILISVLMACILLIPTLNVIFYNRGETNVIITLKELLTPGINTDYIMYQTYGVGLMGIVVIAIVYTLLSKKRENFLLGIFLSLITIFPIFNYLLNGTMYIDAKILIPILPVFSLTIAIFVKDLFDKLIERRLFQFLIVISLALALFSNSDMRYLVLLDIIITFGFIFIFIKTKKELLLIIPLVIITFIVSLGVNENDDLVLKEEFIGTKYYNEKKVIKEITENDSGIYRIGNHTDLLTNINRTYENPNYYQSTLYSSTSNLTYNKFFYDWINNPIQMRNRAITATNYNLISNILLGNKYIMNSGEMDILGYESMGIKENIFLYKSELAFPIIYASENILSYDDFNKLEYPYYTESFLKTIVAESNSTLDFESSIEKLDIDLKKLNNNTLNITDNNDVFEFTTDKLTHLNYELPEKYKNHIIFIRFDMKYSQSCSGGDTEIIINGTKNKLTCTPWKYHNNNYLFDYQISLTDDTNINISLSKAKYKIANIEVYALDYNDIKDVKKDITEFDLDLDKTKGDKIVGTINVDYDGYVATTIPYDKGFTVLVDGEKTTVEMVNKSFVGFKINSGEHNIEIIYKAPYRNIALIISGVGFALFTGIFVYEITSKRKLKRTK